jgi:hypothetical protein
MMPNTDANRDGGRDHHDGGKNGAGDTAPANRTVSLGWCFTYDTYAADDTPMVDDDATGGGFDLGTGKKNYCRCYQWCVVPSLRK